MVCTEKSNVIQILQLRGRDAIIELSNNETKVVNQAFLKPGDEVCVKWVRS